MAFILFLIVPTEKEEGVVGLSYCEKREGGFFGILSVFFLTHNVT